MVRRAGKDQSGEAGNSRLEACATAKQYDHESARKTYIRKHGKAEHRTHKPLRELYVRIYGNDEHGGYVRPTLTSWNILRLPWDLGMDLDIR